MKGLGLLLLVFAIAILQCSSFEPARRPTRQSQLQPSLIERSQSRAGDCDYDAWKQSFAEAYAKAVPNNLAEIFAHNPKVYESITRHLTFDTLLNCYYNGSRYNINDLVKNPCSQFAKAGFDAELGILKFKKPGKKYTSVSVVLWSGVSPDQQKNFATTTTDRIGDAYSAMTGAATDVISATDTVLVIYIANLIPSILAGSFSARSAWPPNPCPPSNVAFVVPPYYDGCDPANSGYHLDNTIQIWNSISAALVKYTGEIPRVQIMEGFIVNVYVLIAKWSITSVFAKVELPAIRTMCSGRNINLEIRITETCKMMENECGTCSCKQISPFFASTISQHPDTFNFECYDKCGNEFKVPLPTSMLKNGLRDVALAAQSQKVKGETTVKLCEHVNDQEEPAQLLPAGDCDYDIWKQNFAAAYAKAVPKDLAQIVVDAKSYEYVLRYLTYDTLIACYHNGSQYTRPRHNGYDDQANPCFRFATAGFIVELAIFKWRNPAKKYLTVSIVLWSGISPDQQREFAKANNERVDAALRSMLASSADNTYTMYIDNMVPSILASSFMARTVWPTNPCNQNAKPFGDHTYYDGCALDKFGYHLDNTLAVWNSISYALIKHSANIPRDKRSKRVEIFVLVAKWNSKSVFAQVELPTIKLLSLEKDVTLQIRIADTCKMMDGADKCSACSCNKISPFIDSATEGSDHFVARCFEDCGPTFQVKAAASILKKNQMKKKFENLAVKALGKEVPEEKLCKVEDQSV